MGNMQQTGWSSQTWRASQVALVVKNPPAKAGGVRRRFSPWARRISWKRAWQCTSAFLPGESHGQGSLAGYSPWGHRESDMTEETQHRPYIEQEATHKSLHTTWFIIWSSETGKTIYGVEVRVVVISGVRVGPAWEEHEGNIWGMKMF